MASTIILWSIIAGMTAIAALMLTIPLWRIYGHSQLSWYSLPILLITVPILLYWQWGSSDAVLAWQQQQERAPQVQQLLSELKSPEQIISRLKKRIAEKPNEVQGWFLLGRLYMSQNRFIEAAAAFVKAEQLQPNDPTILFQHAEAEFYQQNQLTPPVENLLQRVLQQIPDHPGAINLLALHAYQTQHYAKAIQLWRRLLAFYPPDSEDNKMLLMAIERAKSKIGQ